MAGLERSKCYLLRPDFSPSLYFTLPLLFYLYNSIFFFWFEWGQTIWQFIYQRKKKKRSERFFHASGKFPSAKHRIKRWREKKGFLLSFSLGENGEEWSGDVKDRNRQVKGQLGRRWIWLDFHSSAKRRPRFPDSKLFFFILIFVLGFFSSQSHHSIHC